MAEQTPNYGLTKPDLEEFYDVEVQNSNMDIIDASLKGLEEDKANSADLTSLEQTVTEHLDQSKKSMKFTMSSHLSVPNNIAKQILWSNVSVTNAANFAILENGRIKILLEGLYYARLDFGFATQDTGYVQASLRNRTVRYPRVADGWTLSEVSSIFYATEGYASVEEVAQNSSTAIDLYSTSTALTLYKLG